MNSLDDQPLTQSGNKTSALVIGADGNGLGTIRSLGRSGVPVVVVDVDTRRPGMHSRYARPHLVHALSGTQLIDDLVTLGERLKCRPLLFPTSDLQVRTISEQRSRLEDVFRLRLPEHDCVSQLLHKRSFQMAAEDLGFPVPRAVSVRNAGDCAGLADINYPAVIKAGSREVIEEGAPRAHRVSSREEAERVCIKIMVTAPDLIVQEWIEGEEQDIYFCLQYRGKDGETVSSFTGRKLRSWPPQTGSTAACTAAPEAAAVLDRLTTDFFKAVGVFGLCSMEFKQDRRSGNFLMIEPTIGRTDWQSEVATLNGVNIPLAAYRHELGIGATIVEKSSVPVIWRDPARYWASAVFSRTTRSSAPTGARIVSSWGRANDPMPFVFFIFEGLRWALHYMADLTSLIWTELIERITWN